MGRLWWCLRSGLVQDPLARNAVLGVLDFDLAVIEVEVTDAQQSSLCHTRALPVQNSQQETIHKRDLRHLAPHDLEILIWVQVRPSLRWIEQRQPPPGQRVGREQSSRVDGKNHEPVDGLSDVSPDRWLVQGVMRDMPDALETEALLPKDRAWLGALPMTLKFDTPLGPLLPCHGLAGNDMGSVTPDDYGYALEVNDDLQKLVREGQFSIVVAGHTHRRMVRRFGDLVIVNPGTLLKAHEPCFAVVNFDARAVQFLDVAGAVVRPMPAVSLTPE
jgi:hypothetical protein